MLTYPNIDPVLLRIGPFFGFGPLEIRWYSLAYLICILFGYYLMRKKWRWVGMRSIELVDSITLYFLLGMIIGARAFYVLIYNFEEYRNGPLIEFIAVWHGGLSFHGALIGIFVASVLFVRKYNVNFGRIGDIFALASPVGLFLGRIANFINGELYGRVTDSPWGMVFPNGGPNPRHPSQLYEAFLEGLVLGVVLWTVWIWKKPKSGFTAGLMCLCYAVMRIFVEFFREPDAQLGFVLGPFSMGQLLSLLLFGVGGYLIWYSQRHGLAQDVEIDIPTRSVESAQKPSRKKKKKKRK